MSQPIRETTDFDEERANLYQQIGHLKSQVAKMTVRLSDDGLDTLSLRVARLVEDQFTMHHPGGRIQRLAKLQLIVREALREIATGEKKWDAWQPSNFLGHPLEITNPDKGGK